MNKRRYFEFILWANSPAGSSVPANALFEDNGITPLFEDDGVTYLTEV